MMNMKSQILFIALSIAIIQAKIDKNDWTDLQIDENLLESKLQTVLDHLITRKTENLQNQLNKMERSNSQVIDILDQVVQRLDELQKTSSATSCPFTEWVTYTTNINKTLSNSVNLLQQEAEAQKEFRQQMENKSCDKINEDMNSKLDSIQDEIRDFGNCNTENIHSENKIATEVANQTSIEIKNLFKYVKNVTHQFNNKSDTLEMLYKKTIDDINSKQIFCEIQKNTIEKEMQELKENTARLLEKKLTGLEDNINIKWRDVEKVMKHYENVTSKCQNKTNTPNTPVIINKEDQCKQHTVEGYHFDPYLRMDNTSFENVKLEKNAEKVEEFDIHIAVKSDQEAMILLSKETDVQPGDNKGVYEIVLGVGGTWRTNIRTTLLHVSSASAVTPNVIFPTKYTYFTVKISQGKDLQVFQHSSEGEKLIIHLTDPNISDVKFISFSSYVGTAYFLYDCPRW